MRSRTDEERFSDVAGRVRRSRFGALDEVDYGPKRQLIQEQVWMLWGFSWSLTPFDCFCFFTLFTNWLC